MAGLCTLLALILIVACIYIVFCATSGKIEKKSQQILRECSRVHIPVEQDPLSRFKNIPPILPIRLP
jgi:hypothetical protein